MPLADVLRSLQDSATITATTESTGIDTRSFGNQGGLSSLRSLVARIKYSAAGNASGANAVTFSIQDSANNSDWATIATATAVDLTTTVQAGEIILPLGKTRRYLRLVSTFSGAGSTPTITRDAYLAVGLV